MQRRLDALTQKWWLYLLFFGLVFIPPISTEVGMNLPSRIGMDVTAASGQYNTLRWIITLFFIILMIMLLILKNRIVRVFSLFTAINFSLVALLQNTAVLENYGRVFILGLMIPELIVSLTWYWEAWANETDFNEHTFSKKKSWIIILALIAFIFPLGIFPGQPEANIINSPVMLAMCLTTPIYLAIYAFASKVNGATIRITSFFGCYLGIFWLVTMISQPDYFYIGILHWPLLIISFYMFITHMKK